VEGNRAHTRDMRALSRAQAATCGMPDLRNVRQAPGTRRLTLAFSWCEMSASFDTRSSSVTETALACVIDALRRTLDLAPTASLRSDTPLADVGVDSLARILVCDYLAASGWIVTDEDAGEAQSIGDLAERATRG
jgi:hypothetical protein